MISEFELLAEKITRLADMTQHLRLENAQLRRELTNLVTENQDLKNRMQQAQEHVERVLAHLPQVQDAEIDENKEVA
jgi:regulator of replication initiation timing